jgi:hypothetical protein
MKLYTENDLDQLSDDELNTICLSFGLRTTARTKDVFIKRILAAQSLIPPFPSPLTMKEANALKINDHFDCYCPFHHHMKEATIIEKQGHLLKIKFITQPFSAKYLKKENEELFKWINYSKELFRFYRHGSILNRPKHRFINYNVGDYVDIKPQLKANWKTGQIKVFHGNHVQITFKHDHHTIGCWAHIDDDEKISEFMSKQHSQTENKQELFRSRRNLTTVLKSMGNSQTIIERSLDEYDKTHEIPYDIKIVCQEFVKLQKQDKIQHTMDMKIEARKTHDLEFKEHMTFNEANNLKIGDKIDHRNMCKHGTYGKYSLSTIVGKRGSKLKIYHNYEHPTMYVWNDYSTNQLHMMAKPLYVSERPSHRFHNIKLNDYVDINPKYSHPGWKRGVVKALSKHSGQIKIKYKHKDKYYSYWCHIDGCSEIARFGEHTRLIKLNNDNDNDDLNTIPPEFMCPISLSLMRNPVLCFVSGYTYEEEAILAWLRENNTEPMTRQKVSWVYFVQNRALKDAIINYLSKQAKINKTQNKLIGKKRKKRDNDSDDDDDQINNPNINSKKRKINNN